MRTVIEGAAVSTVDDDDTFHESGYVVIEDGLIAAVGGGDPDLAADRYVDGRGCLVTPGFVNTHHHLYQWATRGYAADSDLFHWLVTLYPVWAGLDEDIVGAAAAAGLARLARTGCTTVADHHYVFPRDGGDVFGALVDAGARIGTRLEAIRGSMDRGESAGGLPPDSLVETLDGALAGTSAAIERHHDAAFGSRLRVAVGPCSPFSVSPELMRSAAALAREAGVRLHTHLAETLDEEKQCRAEFGCSPVEYADRVGYLGSDVWLGHGVHLDPAAVALFGRTGTGVAHCPTSNARLASGIAPVRALLDAGAPVGLGVDGAASNEDGGLIVELRQAVWLARLAGRADALTARQALRLATAGGAACLGRSAEIGSLRPGMLADLAVWDLSTMDHAGIADPVTALVFGPIPPLALLLVGGETVVERDELRTADETSLATALRRAAAALASR
jgi:cytosine/adenosine deaminase-related metal-dependent hydrolase